MGVNNYRHCKREDLQTGGYNNRNYLKLKHKVKAEQESLKKYQEVVLLQAANTCVIVVSERLKEREKNILRNNGQSFSKFEENC